VSEAPSQHIVAQWGGANLVLYAFPLETVVREVRALAKTEPTIWHCDCGQDGPHDLAYALGTWHRDGVPVRVLWFGNQLSRYPVLRIRGFESLEEIHAFCDRMPPSLGQKLRVLLVTAWSGYEA